LVSVIQFKKSQFFDVNNLRIKVYDINPIQTGFKLRNLPMIKKYCIIVFSFLGLLSGCNIPKIKTDYPKDSGMLTPITESQENNNTCRIRSDIVSDSLVTIDVPLLEEHTVTDEDVIPPKDEPPRFAYSIPVTISPYSHGSWQQIIDESTQIWRVRIVSQGAVNLNLGFTKFKMPSGGCMFIYSPDQRTILGPYSEKDNEVHGQLWTPIINGDVIIIEVTVPSQSISELELEIGFVNHGFQ
jgi:hypothetical protein